VLYKTCDIVFLNNAGRKILARNLNEQHSSCYHWMAGVLQLPSKKAEGPVRSGDLRQMSEYPHPHGEHCHSCILRRWRPAFLHPKGEIPFCHRADEQNALKVVPLPQ
jgi:hypothetical protein